MVPLDPDLNPIKRVHTVAENFTPSFAQKLQSDHRGRFAFALLDSGH
jgi:hypothetical protein